MTLNIKKGIQPRAQKVVIYGPEGIGKTTLASQFPEPLFLDLEDGSAQLNINRINDITNWTQLASVITEVINTPDICRTLIIDTADKAEMMASQWLCQKNGKNGIEEFGYGKGYQYLAEQTAMLLSYLDLVMKKGINVIVIAHAMMRKFEQPDEMGAYDRWELKLNKKVAPLYKEWADMMLFINYKTNVTLVDGGKAKASGGKRVIYATHSPCWDAKNRHGLPDEFDLDYKVIKPIFEEGEKNESKQK